jgi:hypothetical protein
MGALGHGVELPFFVTPQTPTHEHELIERKGKKKRKNGWFTPTHTEAHQGELVKF